jgi:hypothetical protein
VRSRHAVLCAALLCSSLIGCSCTPEPPRPDAGVPDAGIVDNVHDPLSRPEQPTLDLTQFLPPESCADCHENHYAEWTQSMHSYSMIDPVFRKLVGLRQAEFDGEQDQFCTQCHSAIGVRTFDIDDNFVFDELDPLTLHGVSCESCHKVQAIERPFNSGHVINPVSPMLGPIADPVANDFHGSAFSPLFEDALFCAGCHDVVELDGLPLERPYAEWLSSPAAAENKTCQDCHMPAYTGIAADGAPERELHRHWFVGVDAPLSPGFLSEEAEAEVKARAQELLASAADLELSAPGQVEPGGQIDVNVSVTNLIDGHNLPTGSTFIRQLWLEVTATDASGRVLYETGDLDDNGDLKDHFSTLEPYADNDLIKFGSSLTDDRGDPQVLPWHSTELSSTAIEPLRERTFTLFVPTDEETVFPVDIDARLRFRAFGPFLLRIVELDELIERLEIIDMDLDGVTVFGSSGPVDGGPDGLDAGGPEARDDAGVGDGGADAGVGVVDAGGDAG